MSDSPIAMAGRLVDAAAAYEICKPQDAKKKRAELFAARSAIEQEITRLRAELARQVPDEDDVPEMVAEAYQIVGAIAHYAGFFDHPDVQRALDYLSGKKIDGEILPWPREALTAAPAPSDGGER